MPSTEFKSINRRHKDRLVEIARRKNVKIHITKRNSVYDVTIMCSTDTLGTTGF